MTRGPGRRYTTDAFSREEFTRMWEAGEKVEVMAIHFGVAVSTISDRAARLRLQPRPRGRGRTDYSHILPRLSEMWVSGSPLKAISGELSISSKTIITLTQRYGLGPRARRRKVSPT